MDGGWNVWVEWLEGWEMRKWVDECRVNEWVEKEMN